MNKGTKTLLIILTILALAGFALIVMMAWPLSGYDLTLVPHTNVWFYLAVVGIVLVLILLFYVLVHVLRQPTRGVDLLDKKEGGTVQISADALRSIAERTAKLRPEVADAKAEVYQNKKDTAVDLVMNLKMKADKAGPNSVRTIAEDIKQDVSREIQNFSGYPLADFHLNVDMDDSDKLPVQALSHQPETHKKTDEDDKDFTVKLDKDKDKINTPVAPIDPIEPEIDAKTEEALDAMEHKEKAIEEKLEKSEKEMEDFEKRAEEIVDETDGVLTKTAAELQEELRGNVDTRTIAMPEGADKIDQQSYAHTGVELMDPVDPAIRHEAGLITPKPEDNL